MRLPLKWEFPGGKVEPDESPEHCIIREIEEELGIIIRPLKRLVSCIYETGEQDIRLIPFDCTVIKGEIHLSEHAAFLWLNPDELKNLDWAEADLPVLQNYLNSL